MTLSEIIYVIEYVKTEVIWLFHMPFNMSNTWQHKKNKGKSLFKNSHHLIHWRVFEWAIDSDI